MLLPFPCQHRVADCLAVRKTDLLRLADFMVVLVERNLDLEVYLVVRIKLALAMGLTGLCPRHLEHCLEILFAHWRIHGRHL